VHVPFVFGRP